MSRKVVICIACLACMLVLLEGCAAHKQSYAVRFGKVTLPPAGVVPPSFAMPVVPIERVVIDTSEQGSAEEPDGRTALGVVVEPDADLQYWVRTIWTLPSAPSDTTNWSNVEKNRDGSYTLVSRRALITGPATFPFVFGPYDPGGEWSVKVVISRKVMQRQTFTVVFHHDNETS